MTDFRSDCSFVGQFFKYSGELARLPFPDSRHVRHAVLPFPKIDPQPCAAPSRNLNGRFVEDAKVKVPVADYSFLYGDGCFEGIGVCEGRAPVLVLAVPQLREAQR